jgi:hypothetical protein
VGQVSREGGPLPTRYQFASICAWNASRVRLAHDSTYGNPGASPLLRGPFPAPSGIPGQPACCRLLQMMRSVSSLWMTQLGFACSGVTCAFRAMPEMQRMLHGVARCCSPATQRVWATQEGSPGTQNHPGQMGTSAEHNRANPVCPGLSASSTILPRHRHAPRGGT